MNFNTKCKTEYCSTKFSFQSQDVHILPLISWPGFGMKSLSCKMHWLCRLQKCIQKMGKKHSTMTANYTIAHVSYPSPSFQILSRSYLHIYLLYFTIYYSDCCNDRLIRICGAIGYSEPIIQSTLYGFLCFLWQILLHSLMAMTLI